MKLMIVEAREAPVVNVDYVCFARLAEEFNQQHFAAPSSTIGDHMAALAFSGLCVKTIFRVARLGEAGRRRGRAGVCHPIGSEGAMQGGWF